MFKLKLLGVALVILVICATSVFAEEQNLASLEAQIRELTATVGKLSAVVQDQAKKIASLEQTKVVSPPASNPAPIAPAVKGSSGAQTFVPEIGVIADIVGSLTESGKDEEGNDRVAVREVELLFGHDVDPYSRLDVTVSISDEETAALEEAYLSYWDLPFELKGRLGRFKPKWGKAAAMHRDSLDTVDEPLVVQEYLGSEGLSLSGVDLSGFTPLVSDNFVQQATFGLTDGGVGDGGTLLGETRRRPTFYSHLSNSLAIGDADNFELGGTYILGSKDEDAKNEVNAFGIDATYIHFITPRNKLKLQSEAFLQHRDEAFIEAADGRQIGVDSGPWGMYALADYRLGEHWGLGTRYDYVEPIDLNPNSPRNYDSAYSGYLTFYQSEFLRWRLQYQYARLADNSDDNRVFLQATAAIGTHKHSIN